MEKELLDAREIFYRECLNHELLTREEEVALLAKAVEGDKDAIDELVRKNQRLVFEFARRYENNGVGGDQEFGDLVQWGNMGLLMAIKRWDMKRTTRFSTYATHWIKSYIRRYGNLKGNALALAFGKSDAIYVVKQSRVFLRNKYGKNPSFKEVAEDTGLPEKTVKFVTPLIMKPLSFDEPKAGHNFYDDELVYGDIIPDPSLSPECEALKDETLQALCDGVQRLPERLKKIMVMRYGLTGKPPLQHNEIAEVVGLTRERVRQLEQESLTRLRVIMSRTALTFEAFDV